jgi:hypothetical protein
MVARRELEEPMRTTSSVLRWTEALIELRIAREKQPHGPMLGIILGQPGAEARLKTWVIWPKRERHDPIPLVVGRHEHCDIPGLREARLRHALLLFWTDAAHRAHPLEVIDLRSRDGLGLGGGKRVHHIVTPGPVRFGVGADEITLIYAAPGAPFPVELPDDLHAWADVERQVALGLERPEDTSLSNASVVHRAPDGTLVRLLDGRRVDLKGVHCVQVRRRDLRQGVILGRYLRCDEASVFASDPRVSRVHAMIIERDGHLYALDVGSSNGTQVIDWSTGERVAELGDRRRLWRLGEWDGLKLGKSRIALELVENTDDFEPRDVVFARALGFDPGG